MDDSEPQSLVGFAYLPHDDRCHATSTALQILRTEVVPAVLNEGSGSARDRRGSETSVLQVRGTSMTELTGRTRRSSIDVNLPEFSELLAPFLQTLPSAAKGVPPHITLLYPWRTAPLSQHDLSEATAAVVGTAPFTLSFSTLGRFPGIPCALYLQPEPDALLRSLMRRLIRAFPDTPPYGGQFPDPVPHLTVAKVPTEAELDRVASTVTQRLQPYVPLVVTVRHIVVQEEGEDGTWTVRATLPLEGA